MLPLIAQAGEALGVAKEAATRLIDEWRVAGILLLVLICVMIAALWLAWTTINRQWTTIKEKDEALEAAGLAREAAEAAIRKEMMAANKEMKDSFVQALKEQREMDASIHAAQIVSHKAEMESHYEMVERWRKEIRDDNKSTRDMLQFWVSRMALARATEDNSEEDPADPAGKASKGRGGK